MNDSTNDQPLDVKQMEADIQLKLVQIQLTAAEELLTIKKVRWYECVLFGGAGITIGLALAKIFMV
jgi:hypothetical protein